MSEYKTSDLIKELSDNRSDLHSMVDDIKKLRDTIDVLLPKQVDFKSKWIIPERMKAVTEIIKAELSIRKQIDDSIKTESDIRRRTGDEDTEKLSTDIRAFAKLMEKLSKEEESKESCDEELNKDEQIILEQEG